MLETKCIGENFKMLMTVVAIFVTNSNIFLPEQRGNYFKKCHQHQYLVINIHKLSPTSGHQHHDATNVTITFIQQTDSISNLFLLYQNGIIECSIFEYGSLEFIGFRDSETENDRTWTGWSEQWSWPGSFKFKLYGKDLN